jgi:gluconate 5-dehydrogenase
MNSAFQEFDLAGKTAFVTGGGTGLGYFMSRGLARSGAKVMIASRRQATLKEAAQKLTLEANGNEVLYRTIDLNDRNNIVNTAASAGSALGGVDIFVGNAAQELDMKLDSVTNEAADEIFQVNVFSNMALVRAFLPHMRQRKWGRIIFSSSVSSIQASAQTGMSLYAASKAAINGYMRVAAAETGHDGITVNSLNLGMYLTEIWQKVLLDKLEATGGRGAVDSFLKTAAANNVLGRIGKCEEVEGIVRLLASDAGSYISGSDIVMDGGLSVLMRPNPVA